MLGHICRRQALNEFRKFQENLKTYLKLFTESQVSCSMSLSRRLDYKRRLFNSISRIMFIRNLNI